MSLARLPGCLRGLTQSRRERHTYLTQTDNIPIASWGQVGNYTGHFTVHRTHNNEVGRVIHTGLQSVSNSTDRTVNTTTTTTARTADLYERGDVVLRICPRGELCRSQSGRRCGTFARLGRGRLRRCNSALKFLRFRCGKRSPEDANQLVNIDRRPVMKSNSYLRIDRVDQ